MRVNRLLLFVLAVASFVLTGYAARQFFFACMASSALRGVPSQVAAQHHFGVLSSVWLLVAVAALVAFIVLVAAIIRHSTARRTS